MGHRISRAFNQDMENRKAKMRSAANRGNFMSHQMNDQYEDRIRKLLSNNTAGNKKIMDQGKVSTEPTYWHPQHTGPNGTARRHGWNSE